MAALQRYYAGLLAAEWSTYLMIGLVLVSLVKSLITFSILYIVLFRIFYVLLSIFYRSI